MNNEYRKLIKAAREADISIIEFRMAAILLSINGIKNALEFIEHFKKKSPQQSLKL